MGANYSKLNECEITAAMIEAGIASLAKTKGADPVDVVSAVYGAMLKASGATITTQTIFPRTFSSNSWGGEK